MSEEDEAAGAAEDAAGAADEAAGAADEAAGAEDAAADVDSLEVEPPEHAARTVADTAAVTANLRAMLEGRLRPTLLIRMYFSIPDMRTIYLLFAVSLLLWDVRVWAHRPLAARRRI
jgi:hypothetical protein